MGFWDEAQQRGGITGSDMIDPWIKDPSDPTGKGEMPNPNPKYKYSFADGTWLVARAVGQPNVNGAIENATDWSIVDWGTAGTSKAKAQQSSADKAKDDYDEARAKKGLAELYDPAPDIRQIGSSVVRVNPKTGQVDVLYTVPKEPSAPTGQLTEYQKWQMAQYPEETAYARGRDAVADLKAEQDRFAGNIRQLSGDYTNAWKEAAQYGTAPGVDYVPTMEPGGLAEQIQKKRGYTHNAEPWRVTNRPFDPWQAALEMYRR